MDNPFDAEELAERYDSPPSPAEKAELVQCVQALAALAEGGPALEFAIGTGRVALPLAEQGVPVSGIELSAAMLAVMARKPGAKAIPTLQGDLATAKFPGAFSMVYLVYNTIGNLLDQEAQIACFENAARHLRPGGAFVIENFIPPLRRFPMGAPGVPFEISPAHTGIDTITTVDQRLVSHHYTRDGSGNIHYCATPQRYTWPAELDLMARIAGLSLRDRWGGWDRRAFDETSCKHISVWVKPA